MRCAKSERRSRSEVRATSVGDRMALTIRMRFEARLMVFGRERSRKTSTVGRCKRERVSRDRQLNNAM